MKIPEHAERVFKGVIFDVYQWQQTLFDGSVVTFEGLKRPATVLVIPIVDGECLLLQEEQPGLPEKLTLVGGRQEDNEEWLVTAKRELLEETGLISDDWEQLHHYPVLGKIDWDIVIFAARGAKKVQEPELDPGEKITPIRMGIDAFIETASAATFPDQLYANDVYRMIHEGTIDAYKKRLLGN